MSSNYKKRLQITEILDIIISPTRCSYYVKQAIDNKTSNSDNIENDKKNTKKDIRINSESVNVISIICNNVITEILKNIIDEINNNNKKKIIDLSVISSMNYINNIYHPIYYKLKAFTNYDIVKNETKKDKKKNNENVEVENAEVENNSTNVNNNVNKNTFNIYIDNILKNIKKNINNDDNNISKIRLTVEVKEYLSNLIIDIIYNFINLSKIIIQQIQSIRTINSNYIKTIFIILMKNELYEDSIINKLISEIDEKIENYNNYVKSEKENKINTLDDESKNKMLEKEKEKNNNKKKRNIELAEKRINEANEKLNKLKSDVVN